MDIRVVNTVRGTSNSVVELTLLGLKAEALPVELARPRDKGSRDGSFLHLNSKLCPILGLNSSQ